MNEHAGPACALSGLIVGLFAILLHDRIPPSPLPKSPAVDASAPASSVAKPVSDSTTSILPPKSTQAVPQAPSDPVGKNRIGVVSSSPSAGKQINVPEILRPVKAEPPTHPVKVSVPIVPPFKSVVVLPRPSFTIVRLGESLGDVATRVYGSDTETDVLWKANRDQVERKDSPLDGGTILRTP